MRWGDRKILQRKELLCEKVQEQLARGKEGRGAPDTGHGTCQGPEVRVTLRKRTERDEAAEVGGGTMPRTGWV